MPFDRGVPGFIERKVGYDPVGITSVGMVDAVPDTPHGTPPSQDLGWMFLRAHETLIELAVATMELRE